MRILECITILYQRSLDDDDYDDDDDGGGTTSSVLCYGLVLLERIL
jgi:hypothetical protein